MKNTRKNEKEISLEFIWTSWNANGKPVEKMTNTNDNSFRDIFRFQLVSIWRNRYFLLCFFFLQVITMWIDTIVEVNWKWWRTAEKELKKIFSARINLSIHEQYAILLFAFKWKSKIILIKYRVYLLQMTKCERNEDFHSREFISLKQHTIDVHFNYSGLSIRFDFLQFFDVISHFLSNKIQQMAFNYLIFLKIVLRI